MASNDEKNRRIDDLFDSGKLEADEADRQRKLNEACRYALKDFVGKELTPLLIAEAEGKLRQAFVDMIVAGVYVLPPDLALDRVELGEDMRIKVYFKRTSGALVGGAS